jgi:hypothetical protein
MWLSISWVAGDHSVIIALNLTLFHLLIRGRQLSFDNEIFPGYQPWQLVKRRKKQTFQGPSLSSSSRMVVETLGFSPLNQLTRIVAREYFIIQCLRENYKSHNCLLKFHSLQKQSYSHHWQFSKAHACPRFVCSLQYYICLWFNCKAKPTAIWSHAKWSQSKCLQYRTRQRVASTTKIV